MSRIGPTKGAVSCMTAALAGILIADGPSRADPAKPEAKQTQTEQREFLPVVLQGALLENEREEVRSLADSFKLFEILREGGLVSDLQATQAEQALLLGQIRVVQREADYRDALDQFKLRFGSSPERLREMEESALLPLARHLKRFEAIFPECDAIRTEPIKNADPEKASELRARLRRSLTGSALVKDTPFAKQAAAQWGAWEKLKDPEEVLREHATKRQKLLDRKTESEGQAKPFPQAEAQQLEEVSFQIELGQFERALRAYESQPWKAEMNADLRQRRHSGLLGQLQGAYGILLQRAVSDRIAQCRQTWPALAQVRIKETDLLTCDPEKAEQVVTAYFNKPEEVVAGKVRTRKVRALAETYRIQQRLFELSLSQVQLTLDSLKPPRVPGEPGRAEDADIGLAQRLLDARRSFAEVKSRAYGTWINYQIARSDLYRELGLTPP